MGSGCSPPVSDRNSPNPSNANIITMKKYVGTANIRPDSRTPRRFPQAMNQMQNTDISTRYEYSAGNADVTAAMPAATDTETVST